MESLSNDVKTLVLVTCVAIATWSLAGCAEEESAAEATTSNATSAGANVTADQTSASTGANASESGAATASESASATAAGDEDAATSDETEASSEGGGDGEQGTEHILIYRGDRPVLAAHQWGDSIWVVFEDELVQYNAAGEEVSRWSSPGPIASSAATDLGIAFTIDWSLYTVFGSGEPELLGKLNKPCEQALGLPGGRFLCGEYDEPNASATVRGYDLESGEVSFSRRFLRHRRRFMAAVPGKPIFLATGEYGSDGIDAYHVDESGIVRQFLDQSGGAFSRLIGVMGQDEVLSINAQGLLRELMADGCDPTSGVSHACISEKGLMATLFARESYLAFGAPEDTSIIALTSPNRLEGNRCAPNCRVQKLDPESRVVVSERRIFLNFGVLISSSFSTETGQFLVAFAHHDPEDLDLPQENNYEVHVLPYAGGDDADTGGSEDGDNESDGGGDEGSDDPIVEDTLVYEGEGVLVDAFSHDGRVSVVFNHGVEVYSHSGKFLRDWSSPRGLVAARRFQDELVLFDRARVSLADTRLEVREHIELEAECARAIMTHDGLILCRFPNQWYASFELSSGLELARALEHQPLYSDAQVVPGRDRFVTHEANLTSPYFYISQWDAEGRVRFLAKSPTFAVDFGASNIRAFLGNPANELVNHLGRVFDISDERCLVDEPVDCLRELTPLDTIETGDEFIAMTNDPSGRLVGLVRDRDDALRLQVLSADGAMIISERDVPVALDFEDHQLIRAQFDADAEAMLVAIFDDLGWRAHVWLLPVDP